MAPSESVKHAFEQAVPFGTYAYDVILICESCAGDVKGEMQCHSCIGAPCECDHFHDPYSQAEYISGQIGEYVEVKVIPRPPIDFTAVTAALDAAHFPADDPVRRAVGGFDMAPVLDPEEAGY